MSFNTNNNTINGVSILIPIYNGIEFINDAIISILSQTFEKWEVIIGINGHELNSEVFNIANKYTLISEKIKVIDLYPICGKSNALNNMITYCYYDWISLLDVDDIWYPTKLEKQINFTSYDVIGTKCIYFGKKELEGLCPNIPTGDISNCDFFETNPIINSSCLVKKKLCYWSTEPNEVEDYELWLRLRYLNNVKFYNVDEILVKHRLHDDSAFNNTNHLYVDSLKNKYKILIENTSEIIFP
jgi:glycosyltransferase involved in cell wall biosynthesis